MSIFKNVYRHYNPNIYHLFGNSAYRFSVSNAFILSLVFLAIKKNSSLNSPFQLLQTPGGNSFAGPLTAHSLSSFFSGVLGLWQGILTHLLTLEGSYNWNTQTQTGTKQKQTFHRSIFYKFPFWKQGSHSDSFVGI